MIPIEVRYFTLSLTRSGTLLPWLGPAVRGLVAGELKQRVCRWPAQEQSTRWRYCAGCPHMGRCAYGSTFELDPPSDRTVLRAARDGQRAITLAPGFPCVPAGRIGDPIPLRLLLIGAQAIGAADEVVSAIASVGATRGFGPDRVRFSPIIPPADSPDARCLVHLQGDAFLESAAGRPGKTCSVGIELVSPLFLKEEVPGRNKAQPVLRPTLAHLVRASLRVVGRTFSVFAPGAIENRIDFGALKALCARDVSARASWRDFRQDHWSNRGGQRYPLRGVVGAAAFEQVPTELVPWLKWGGVLGVGEHRAAGAGMWRLTVD